MNDDLGEIRMAADAKLREIEGYWKGKQHVAFEYYLSYKGAKEKEAEARICYEKALAEYNSIFESDDHENKSDLETEKR